ncbi:xanthine dehydrogenase family protein subunit M [Salinimonas sp. HHU 13199]|uniref:Xanthine dehydrogenase family protein subunit M n=1 Tax=Salinimonas profundi TaxID=2729140 RepID=A0ABR8LIP5_9ALTE|nr:xanthine dehydrogenase family protein subunit M [Salinimonas profundi]MBD3585622.1 xanthine dehydrogenase family protein subunit M [Salinimonas profundi]
MRPFTVNRLTDTQHLNDVDSFENSRFLAGGTNLVDLMKHQIETPDTLVDLSGWESADTIEETDETYQIGAMVSNTDLANFAYRKEDLSLLSQALLSGATVQLRNRATTGGNLLQRTRCYYFYDTNQPCNKRQPGSGCAALDGFNRIHAVLGTSEHCIASHPSDMAVAMAALDAKVKTINPAGNSRHIPVRELYRLPGDTPHIETVLGGDELIVSVDIPKRPRGTQIYRKVRDRSSYAFALVSVACDVTLKDGVIDDVSLAFGGVGTMPWHAKSAEDFLRGKTATSDLYAQACDIELSAARGAGSNDFKIPLIKRTAAFVLEQAVGQQMAHPGHQGAIHAR